MHAENKSLYLTCFNSIMYDKITNALDNKKVTLGLFINLSKAFDTKNHENLLDKLKHRGVRYVALEWFKIILSKAICAI